MKITMRRIIILCIIILFSESVLSYQTKNSTEKYKRDAIIKIDQGRYGEAIDLLNKFISANPQNHEGYELRASCYEARGQYEYSVYDLRSALKLQKDSRKISQSLHRVTETWYSQLYNKIEGHKREIAVSPGIPKNYLEIGKCYKHLGNWNAAEEWYDKYLNLEEPSPDEVIRYTEILAKNNHISKGEAILKRFVEKYPQDHRLWSRYGYFTLWLGKNKVAVTAFTEALNFRPYFKEAIDGLSLATGKGAVYTVNDTSYHFNKFSGKFQKRGMREYPIDRYFRLLKKNPSDDSTRVLLVNALLEVNRLQEAKQQLEILQKNQSLDDFTLSTFHKNLQEKWDYIISSKINDAKKKLAINPLDSKALKVLGEYYSLQGSVDSLTLYYDEYLRLKPQDEEIRFDFAKKLSWSKKFETAKDQIDILLNAKPTKKEYQLLRAQISVWTNTDLNYAKSLLEKVLSKDPDNIDALSSLAELSYQTQNFQLSESFINRLEKVNPNHPNLEELKNNLVLQQKRFEETQLDSILYSARNLVTESKCAEAVSLFKIYLDKTNAPQNIYLEYANALTCSNNYPEAIKIYSDLLNKKYDYDLAKQRAKLSFWSGDITSSIKEFKALNSINKDDTEVKLFLADSYFNQKDYVNSKKIYSELLSESPSSVLLKNRMTWLPGDVTTDGSFSSLITNFPIYSLITPEMYFFKDNLSFKLSTQGLRSEFGITKFLSLGGSVFRGEISSDSAIQKFYTIMGNVVLIPTKFVTASIGFGRTNYLSERKQNILDFNLKFESKEKYSLTARIYDVDGSQFLYSPFLIDSTIRVIDYSVEGKYFTPNNLILSGAYAFRKLSDDNKGYDLKLSLGRKFSSDFIAGYEYNYLDYQDEAVLYYSPNNFESHSLWADYKLIEDAILDFSIGGKIGVIPKSDLLVKEFNSKLSIKFIESLTMQVQAVFSENAREVVNYSSSSISAMLFWLF
ncbi:MAG: tetratricopeptide repeat protein [Ignavibacteriaceae bacterium]|nr:tetratricopeptide repeat protein [Ignavibacteriaceae bacterium]